MFRDETESKPSGDNHDEKSYDVGYGKPPKHTRFKKGTSGNPTGRPKKDRNHEQTFRMVFDAPIKAVIEGKRRYLNGHEAVFWQLRMQISTGNLRAIKIYLDYCRQFKIDRWESSNVQLEGLFAALMAGPKK